MFYEDDFDTFLDTASFGKSVSFAPNGGAVSTIVGQFFNEYESVNVVGMDAESQIPMIIVKDTDVVGIGHEAVFSIDSEVYFVREVKPDGTGLTTAMLSKDTETLNCILDVDGGYILDSNLQILVTA